jgi:hypothetical protein
MRSSPGLASRRRRNPPRLLLALTLGLAAALAVIGQAKADPIYCYGPPHFSAYTGVTDASRNLISPDGSFTDPNSWDGPYTGVDPTTDHCYGKLPPQPGDTLLVPGMTQENKIQ